MIVECFSGIFHETGFELEKFLQKIGVGKKDRYFWKQVGKSLLITYAIIGAGWVYNETSPLGWWTLKPMPKEERELAHLYERREYPYPGDEEAMEEFIAKGAMIGTTIAPNGSIESDRIKQDLRNEKFDQEAQKLWLRMRNEVIGELQEKGFDVE